MYHEIVLGLDDEQFERLSVFQRYLRKTWGGDVSSLSWEDFDRIYSLSYLIESGLFSGPGLYDLSCLSSKEKIADMKEYLSRTEGK